MEQATRRYILRVLIIHAGLLAVVAAVTLFGAYQVYQAAALRSEEQAADRQQLIARQTAGSLENYFDAIVSNLDLLRRVESEGLRPNPVGRRLPPNRPTPAGDTRAERAQTFAAAPSLWAQLSDRTAGLVVCDTQFDSIVLALAPPEDVREIRALVAENAALTGNVDGPTVSRPVTMAESGRQAALVTVPAGESGRYHLISVVELQDLRDRFFGSLSNTRIPPLLLDGNGVIVSAADATNIGRPMPEIVNAQNLGGQVSEVLATRTAKTFIRHDPIEIGGVRVDGAMVTIQPVNVAGQTWFIGLVQDLSRVNAVVNETYRDAFVWATFVIIAALGVLLSTSISAIRGRSRLERLRSEMVERELQMLDDELEAARKIQLNWLPKEREQFGGVSVAAVNTPASHISGDFYDFFELGDGRIALSIGDVTGHGMAAAFLMATTQLLVRTSLERTGDPGRVLKYVNKQLARQVFGGQFVTMLVTVYDPQSRELVTASAGHHPPLLLAGGKFQKLPTTSGLVLGVDEDVAYDVTTHTLPADARGLLLYTDGLIEAQNAVGDRYSLDQLCDELPGDITAAGSLAEEVILTIDRFSEGQEYDDDLTLVAVTFDPAPSHSPAPIPTPTTTPEQLEAAAVG
jgi:serine phosphatase RsbU (regulator of sigma subunit)